MKIIVFLIKTSSTLYQSGNKIKKNLNYKQYFSLTSWFIFRNLKSVIAFYNPLNFYLYYSVFRFVFYIRHNNKKIKACTTTQSIYLTKISISIQHRKKTTQFVLNLTLLYVKNKQNDIKIYKIPQFIAYKKDIVIKKISNFDIVSRLFIFQL